MTTKPNTKPKTPNYIMKHLGTRGGLASARAKGRLSEHDYLMKLNRADIQLSNDLRNQKLSG